MANAKTQGETTSISELERVREIIFGTQMRQYEQASAAAQQDLKRLEEQITQLQNQVTEMGGGQTKQVQALRQEIQAADSELRNEMRQLSQLLQEEKVSRALLGDLFVELGNQIKGEGSLTDLLQDLLKAE